MKLRTVCTQIIDSLNQLELKYSNHRELTIQLLSLFTEVKKKKLKKGDNPNKLLNQCFDDTNKTIIKYFHKEPLVIALKEILSPVGLIPELMGIVAFYKLSQAFTQGLAKKNEQIEGPLTNPKVYRNGILVNDANVIWHWKRKSLLHKEEKLKKELRLTYPKVMKLLTELQPLQKEDIINNALIPFSKNSLQRSLALRLVRERSPEKAKKEDILFLRHCWFLDGIKHRSSWYEVLKKLKKVHPRQTSKFKEERLKKQRFIVGTMESSEGSFKERLKLTTDKVNERFPRLKPYSTATIKREYMRAKTS